jgi:hypothetical protein
MRTITRAGAVLGAVLLASCGGDSTPTLALLEIEPAVTEVTEHLRAGVTVWAVMDDGSRQDVTAEAELRAVDEAVATVREGEVLAATPGDTYLLASWGGLQASARVRVLPAVLLRMRLTTSDATIAAGLIAHVAAEGDFSDGTVRDLTAAVVWSTRPADEACEAEEEDELEGPVDVDDDGDLHGHYACAVVLVATVGDVSAEVPLTVTPAAPAALTLALGEATLPVGGHAHLLVTARLSDGTSRDVTAEATVEVLDDDVAAWEDGELQAERIGTTEVRATWQGLAATASVQVTEAVLRSILIVPPEAEIVAGQQYYFTAVGTFSDGSVRDETAALRWTTSDDAIAVSNFFIRQGLILARAPGTALIRAADPATGVVGEYVLVIPR